MRVQDGFGLGYFLQPEHMAFNCAAWARGGAEPRTEPADLVAALQARSMMCVCVMLCLCSTVCPLQDSLHELERIGMLLSTD